MNRKEGLLMRFLYASFYRLWSWLSPISLQVDSGDFCLMSRRIVDELNKLPETLRFPRGLRSWVGFAQTAIQYDRPARGAGQSSYGWRSLYRLATDGIAAMSLRPLQLSQILALLYFLASGVGVAALLSNVFGGLDVHTQLNWILLLILLGNGLILLCVYILGSYVGRAYWEVKGRPGYIVAERVVVSEQLDPEHK
jgi:dolichol-phosphate mannosyltransferase